MLCSVNKIGNKIKYIQTAGTHPEAYSKHGKLIWTYVRTAGNTTENISGNEGRVADIFIFKIQHADLHQTGLVHG
jgi:hypothetical protein